MAKIEKFKLRKAKLTKIVNGVKKTGWYLRMLTNGTTTIEDLVEDAGNNTTAHRAEIKMSLELCLDAASKALKQGKIVDLGPLGKLYPSVSSKWTEDEKLLSLNDARGKVNYKPSDDISVIVRGALFQWATADDKDKPTTDEEAGDTDNENNTPSVDTSTNTTDASTGGNTNDGEDGLGG